MSPDRLAIECEAESNIVHSYLLSADSVAELTSDILEDVLRNIVLSTVLGCHRAEKLLRMQSAATQAESMALAALEPQPHKPTALVIPSADTRAARYDNGRVFLRGNPLRTTPDMTCAHCKLPRLMHPIMGRGMHTPDLSREYCMLYPWVQRPGHDVYGNPFPTDMAKTKKERELIKQQQKHADRDSISTPGSQDADLPTAEPKDPKEIKLNTGGKPASYIPWHTCPNCKRSLLITRFAQHLEKCLGISGRQSSRNAMAKLVSGPAQAMASTPVSSRMGTPAPVQASAPPPVPKTKLKGISPNKRLTIATVADTEPDELTEDIAERKKSKKKSIYVKKADREKTLLPTTLKVKLKTSRPNIERKQSEASERSDGKRDRDGEDISEAPQKKKIKLNLSKPLHGGTSVSIDTPSAADD